MFFNIGNNFRIPNETDFIDTTVKYFNAVRPLQTLDGLYHIMTFFLDGKLGIYHHWCKTSHLLLHDPVLKHHPRILRALL
jgi:hypothetical protein